VDVDDVVGVIRADLVLAGGQTGGNEEISGKAGYSDAKQHIVSKSNGKQLKKHVPTTHQVYRVYHSSLRLCNSASVY
jgi:hypothetical protein